MESKKKGLKYASRCTLSFYIYKNQDDRMSSFKEHT